jgi:Protein SET DOMAIN GROUP 2 C-terminal
MEDRELLKSFGLKECLMDGVPDWLFKWTCLICKYISFEELIYPEIFKTEFPNLTVEALKLDAKNLRDGKV